MRIFKFFLVTLSLSACTSLCMAQNQGSNPADPWESFNRKIFSFNEGLDQAVVRPVAVTYKT